jgi:hypothetical protein
VNSHPSTTAQREAALLASDAMHSADSRGRKHPEAEHPYRGPFQRDRDRLVHSSAFRRLSGKMQVFTGERGDYHRTRLTHTHEVASIARTIGRALRLNEDLVEALALFHDLGRTSLSARGSSRIVWVAQLNTLMKPGATASPPASSSSTARAPRRSPTAAMRSPRIPTSASNGAPPLPS